MKEFNPATVVKKLIGPINPIGAEVIDGDRLDNLKDYIETFFEIYSDILLLVDLADSHYSSKAKIGKLALQTIKDLYLELHDKFNKNHIVRQVQHRSTVKYMNKEMKDFIIKFHPEIHDENEMVELIETRSYEIQNHWISEE